VKTHVIHILAKEQAQPSMWPMMVMMLLIFVEFMFFMSRSRKRQESQHKKMIESLEPGTRVLLNSGLMARVDKIDTENQEARLLVDEEKKVHAVYSLMAIAKVFEETKSAPKKDD
jgi:preprotein translocase YajC subunit